MRSISIQKIGITDLKTDVIVNAANSGLWAGSGVCGAIFDAAGKDRLQAACNQYGHCDPGSAVITEGFDLKAKYIIHAVGPQYRDGRHGEPQLLYSAYIKSLELAAAHGCTSIGFPLISAGIYGYPKEAAWRKAIQACRDFLERNSSISMQIIFAVVDDRILALGEKVLAKEAPGLTAELSTKQKTVTAGHSGQFDHLQTNNRLVEAVFFHKPEEPYGFLSNWHISPFMLDGISFSSCEQYIMYRKCMVFGDTSSARQVLGTDDVALQQEIGRGAQDYDDRIWNGMRQLAARRGLTAKFSQNPVLLEMLLQTKDAWLVECAVSDTVWACGIGLQDEARRRTAAWRGQNILGFALMDVRDSLKKRST